MIDELQVQNLALIRDASLQPGNNLTVITGETGAGKTALLSALKLLMGSRASADLVRDGESALSVSCRLIPCKATDDEPCDELVVSRRVSSDGRSRASLDGTMASVRELAHCVAPKIDLCGQFEHQQLMRTATHVDMLDAWAGDSVKEALTEYQETLRAANRAKDELRHIREASELSSSALEEARFDLRRINEVAPFEGEYESLKKDLEIAEHAESLATSVNLAHEALSAEGGALDGLNEAAAALESAGAVDPDLLELAASLREAGFVLEDASATARQYRDGIEFDPNELAQQQERFQQLSGLIRAYGPRMEDVFARKAAAEEAVSLVDDSAARQKEAEQALEQAEQHLEQAADALDEARAQVAPSFASKTTAVMSKLEMKDAEIVCSSERLDRAAWTASGPSSFEFLYRPASGMQARPLARIASGGEVSRVMLACKVVLGAQDDVETLVFDEVDAGVGGATANALAEVIAELSRTHQVIVVTHLAQVAVKGDVHYVVSREGGETTIAPVTGADREQEIARMLSGTATETSLAHARELLGQPC